MGDKRRLSRRDFLRLTAATATGALAAACRPATPQIVEVEKEVPVEKKVVQTVEVEKVVEKIVTPTPKPVKKVTIRNLVWGASAEQVPMYEMFAEAFHERNPHITVEYLFVPTAQYMAKLKTMEAAGDPPEVCMPIGGHMHAFRGPDFTIWLDLGPFIEQTNFDMSDFAEPAMIAVRHPFTKAMEGIPLQLFAGFIAYNKNMFAEAGLPEPPHSWKEEDWDPYALLDLAIKLTVDENGKHPDEAGFDPEKIKQYGFYDYKWPHLWGWIFGGQGLQTDENDPRTVQIADEKFIEGVQFWQDMIYKYHVAPKPYALEEVLGQAFVAAPFNSGRVAMSSKMTWHLKTLKGIKDFEWDVAAQIHGPGEYRDRYQNRLCVDQGAITAHSKYHEASWEWVSYIASPAMSMRFSVDLRHCLPARLSDIPHYAKRMAEIIPGIDAKLIAEGLRYAHYMEYWRPPSGWQDIWKPYADKIKMGEATAKEALTEVAPLIQANWDEYYSQFK